MTVEEALGRLSGKSLADRTAAWHALERSEWGEAPDRLRQQASDRLREAITEDDIGVRYAAVLAAPVVARHWQLAADYITGRLLVLANDEEEPAQLRVAAVWASDQLSGGGESLGEELGGLVEKIAGDIPAKVAELRRSKPDDPFAVAALRDLFGGAAAALLDCMRRTGGEWTPAAAAALTKITTAASEAVTAGQTPDERTLWETTRGWHLQAGPLAAEHQVSLLARAGTAWELTNGILSLAELLARGELKKADLRRGESNEAYIRYEPKPLTSVQTGDAGPHGQESLAQETNDCIINKMKVPSDRVERINESVADLPPEQQQEAKLEALFSAIKARPDKGTYDETVSDLQSINRGFRERLCESLEPKWKEYVRTHEPQESRAQDAESQRRTDAPKTNRTVFLRERESFVAKLVAELDSLGLGITVEDSTTPKKHVCNLYWHHGKGAPRGAYSVQPIGGRTPVNSSTDLSRAVDSWGLGSVGPS